VQEDPIVAAYCTVPAFRWKNMFYPELKMPYMALAQPIKGSMRGISMEALGYDEEIEKAMEKSMKDAEKREKRADWKRKLKKHRKCKSSMRLPLWFRHVTMFLCLAYCSVMALITIVYGIKFTLRGEELARQQDVTQWGGMNITYFNNESTNASMMSFELNESIALDLAFVTLEELATRRNFTYIDFYDVDRYANDTVEIVRAVEEEEDVVYSILGQKGTVPSG
jgi:hypothetical protein